MYLSSPSAYNRFPLVGGLILCITFSYDFSLCVKLVGRLPVNLLVTDEKRQETCSESETSTSIGWKEASELPDSSRSAKTVPLQSERMLPATATEAPSLASCWQTARPIPVPPPAFV